jgi:hypothetical protein
MHHYVKEAGHWARTSISHLTSNFASSLAYTVGALRAPSEYTQQAPAETPVGQLVAEVKAIRATLAATVQARFASSARGFSICLTVPP